MTLASNIASRVRHYLHALSEGTTKVYWISFAILFTIMFLCMALPLVVMGKGFLWLDDGLTQQYTSFILLGDWYRSLLSNIFVDHSFIVPMWTEATGYGEDYILAISSYIGNPFFLTAVFSDAHNADTLLDLSVVMTLLAAGISFTLLAKSHWNNGFAILAGCMVYVFSGFSLIAFHQVHMLYPLALCPLIFLGVEWVFQGRRPLLLIASMALLLFYSLYTGYICCLLLVIFCIARFIFSRSRTPKRFLKLFLTIAGSIVLAIVLSATFFLPSAIDLLSQNRVSLERDSSLFYSFWYYLRIYEGFLTFDYAGSECFIGFFPIALACLLMLAAMRKSRISALLISLFVSLTLILLLPFLGSVFNGFSYPNNRWIWAYSMLMGIITVYVLDAAGKTGSLSRKRCRNALIAYIALNMTALAFLMLVKLMCPDLHPFGDIKKFLLLAAIAVALFVLLIFKGGKGPIWKGTVLGSLIVSCLIVYGMWFLPGWGNAASHNVTAGQAYEDAVTNTSTSLILDLPQGKTKYDAVGSATTWRNSGIAAGQDSASFYNSMYNDAIDAYHSRLGLTTSPFNISYESMDARPAMEAMAGVDYIIQGAQDEQAHSDSFDTLVLEKEVNGNQYALYKSDHVLPLALVYDAGAALQTKDAESLTAAEAQDLILHSVMLDSEHETGDSPSVEECEVVPYALTILNNDTAQSVDYSDMSAAIPAGTNAIQVKNSGSTIQLSASIPAGKRAYLCVKGVGYSPLGGEDASPMGTAESNGIIGALRTAIRNLTEDETTGCSLTATCGEISKEVWQLSSNTHLYGGKDSWAFNLGISDSPRDGVSLVLNTPGYYSIEDLEIVIEDDEAVARAIAKLAEDGADDISFEENTLTCSAVADDDGDILFFRLPYSTGWHLEVDEKSANLEKASIGFMATKLSKGKHDIVLSYETPGINTGSLLSVLGLAGIAAWIIAAVVRSRAHGAS